MTTAKKPVKRPAKRPASKKAAKKVAVRAPAPAKLVVPDGERAYLLDVPWAERSLASSAGAKWDKTLRAWIWVGVDIPEALAPYASKPLSWERWKEDELNGSSEPDYTEPGTPTNSKNGTSAANSIVLHDHQQAAADMIAVAHISDLPGFLLADDVGLGKTYATIAGVMKLRPKNALVLCPLAVVPHWRKSIAAMGAGKATNWIVINYDRAKTLLAVPDEAAAAKRTRTKNKRIAALGTPLINWDVIVFDEAHLLRNPQSQRSTACRRLAGEGSDHKAFCLWLSATAGQNPLHLSYLAPLLGAATGTTVGDLSEFQYWADAQGMQLRQGMYGAWEWVRNDGDLEHMRHILFEGRPRVGMRRRPTDIAGWPEQQRIPHPVELDPRGWQLYNEAWTEFRRALDLSHRGGNPQSALVAQLRFRQKASYVRVPGTVELIEDLLENDMQVAVSVQFLESLDGLIEILQAKKIKVAAIHGQMSADEKESERIRFQQGDAPVILFTPTEGISLHAGEDATEATEIPRALVIHDVRYSALDMKQVEGRCHRDGQNAIAYYMYADGTVEENIVHKTIQRLVDMGTMLGDDSDWVNGIYETILKYKTA